jgi:hypothetical protein
MNHIGEIAQLITAIVLALNWWQSRQNGKKIEEVHLATNSMKDALVASTAKENFAAGVKQGEDNPRETVHAPPR